MLPVSHRLRRSQDFETAVRGGRRAGRYCLVLHLRLGQEQHCQLDQDPHVPARPPRAGFVVSRAVGPAVVRNLVRRRLRHLIRDRLDALPPGSLLVARALPAAATASYQQLAADLDRALHRLLSGGANGDGASRRRREGGER